MRPRRNARPRHPFDGGPSSDVGGQATPVRGLGSSGAPHYWHPQLALQEPQWPSQTFKGSEPRAPPMAPHNDAHAVLAVFTTWGDAVWASSHPPRSRVQFQRVLLRGDGTVPTPARPCSMGSLCATDVANKMLHVGHCPSWMGAVSMPTVVAAMRQLSPARLHGTDSGQGFSTGRVKMDDAGTELWRG